MFIFKMRSIFSYFAVLMDSRILGAIVILLKGNLIRLFVILSRDPTIQYGTIGNGMREAGQ